MTGTRESADEDTPSADVVGAASATGSGAGDLSALTVPELAMSELGVSEHHDEDTLFPMTADLTLARGTRAPDADGVTARPVGELAVVASDPRRETVDDPRIPADKLFFKIGEVAKLTGVKPYVLRYWETEFPWIRPSKTSSGQRLYRRQDIGVLLEIRRLRHEENRTIADTKEQIRERRGLERSRRPSKPPRKVPSAATAAAGPAALPPASMPATALPAAVAPLLRELRREVANLLAVVDGYAATA